ncbi:MAG: hypothetical protein GEU90_19375 [Gemmatimonas sp.]|nr:hypothetical protein [Gemmatimonas sp.]
MAAWSLIALAIACTISGVALLYRSWTRRPDGARAVAAVGWLLLGATAVPWFALDGWEFGAIYAITVPSLAAGLILWLVADRRRRRAEPLPRWSVAAPGWPAVRKVMGTFLLVVPFGAVASTVVTGAAGLLLPISELNQLVFIVCVMPIVWGLFAYRMLAAPSRRRSVLSLAALSGLGLVTILAL